MPAQNTSQLKEKIISILRIKGPNLPVHIAREIGLSILFTSAFLSELLSEKKIKISHMKVGNSPIYFIPGQESRLENFSQYLKSKEKDAFILLKEKKFLKDKSQDPAIRVALRAIKDFAIPFKKNEEIFWKYFTTSEINFTELETIKNEFPKKEQVTPQVQKINAENIEKKESFKEKKLDIFNKPVKKKKKTTKKKSKKQNDKLFNKIKDFLSKENMEIVDFQTFNKNEIVLKIKEDGKEKLLIAYNKKRITELDLLKTYKKLNDKTLPYLLLSFGEPPKKLMNLIEVIKKLDKIKKIEKQDEQIT